MFVTNKQSLVIFSFVEKDYFWETGFLNLNKVSFISFNPICQ
ncbi:hypothetical protein HMPREF3228_00679 [Streptococcus mitis]|uniref:Uncharacterized protein n=1 Tax=Streptococcus mitis TaxID=28037 RepID=A0A133S0D7_STRMT|nr:hypothetical protein HMPREF3228_00679 [Streptococcus mitis]